MLIFLAHLRTPLLRGHHRGADLVGISLSRLLEMMRLGKHSVLDSGCIQ